MHGNGVLLQRLFNSLDQHDHQTMAACYHPAATFHDIAFDLNGRARIHDMWRMICEGNSGIRATCEVVHANDREGLANLVDTYTFGEAQRKVRNVITSRFRFQDGLIIEHRDTCDARAWAEMAVGGVSGWLAGRSRLLRSWKANRKLDQFLREHPVPVTAPPASKSL